MEYRFYRQLQKSRNNINIWSNYVKESPQNIHLKTSIDLRYTLETRQKVSNDHDTINPSNFESKINY